MSDIGIRKSDKPFVDPANFPRGFRKSGDFSIAESDLLTTYGATLLGLEMNELQPVSEQEQQFVAFIAEQGEGQNQIQKAWAKYIKLARKKRNFYTLYSSSFKSDDSEVYDSDEETELQEVE